MKRKNLVNIHLYFSAFFLPFLVLIAVSGTSYLFLNKGEVKKTKVAIIPLFDKDFNEGFIKKELRKIDQNYKYEYMKSENNKRFTRPTTRASYEIVLNDKVVSFYKLEPSFLKKIIEVHKGHGPSLLKWFQKILGISLIIILTSGMFISFTRKDHKKISLLLISLGTATLASLIYLL